MDVCLNSTFHATKAALPGMVERGWGRVINTGSMHAIVASPYKSAYNAAKHGVVNPPPPSLSLPQWKSFLLITSRRRICQMAATCLNKGV